MRPEEIGGREANRVNGYKRIPESPQIVNAGGGILFVALGADHSLANGRSVSVFGIGDRLSAITSTRDSVTIGRNSNSDIPFSRGSISWNHASIQRPTENGEWHIVDRGSLNGTFMDAVEPIEDLPVRRGERRIPAGEWRFIPRTTSVDFLVTFGSEASRVVTRGDQRTLSFGDGEGIDLPLNIPQMVGRGMREGISLTMPGSSRYHSILIPIETGFIIGDLDSTNGTYVILDGELGRSIAEDSRPRRLRRDQLNEDLSSDGLLRELAGAERSEPEFVRDQGAERFADVARVTISAERTDREDLSIVDKNFIGVLDGDKREGERPASGIAGGEIWQALRDLGDNPRVDDVVEAMNASWLSAGAEMPSGMGAGASVVYLTREHGQSIAVVGHTGIGRIEVVKNDRRVIPITLDQGYAYADYRVGGMREEVLQTFLKRIDNVRTREAAESLGEYWDNRGDMYFDINADDQALPTIVRYVIKEDDFMLLASTSGAVQAHTPEHRGSFMFNFSPLEDRVRELAESSQGQVGVRKTNNHITVVAGTLRESVNL